MPLDETEAWERMRAAILRDQADPTERNLAEKNRCSSAFRAVFCPEDTGLADEPSEREAA